MMSKAGAPRHHPIPIGEIVALRKLPSVDEVLRTAKAASAAARYGRAAVVAAVRETLAAARADGVTPDGSDGVAAAALTRLEIAERPNLQPVFNLTGTVLHTDRKSTR